MYARNHRDRQYRRDQAARARRRARFVAKRWRHTCNDDDWLATRIASGYAYPYGHSAVQFRRPPIGVRRQLLATEQQLREAV